ncbi:hypothetical protein K1719_023607 [Acacia pycnantha]|nr:hypothetical protein K1719_023607 [Acacia pycnantha]
MEPRLLALMFLVALSFPAFAQSLVRHYKFNASASRPRSLVQLSLSMESSWVQLYAREGDNVIVRVTNHVAIHVNGKFRGPTLYAREGDNVIVRITNHGVVHWHGVGQFRTGWSDGSAYITQCPIQPGRGIPYPFPKPHKEKVLIVGDWWKADVEAELNQSTVSGLPPNSSDAHIINGLPGQVPGCTSQLGGYTLHVERGKTYLHRIVKAAVNNELLFKIAWHNLTIVEADASCVKPFETDTIPGQTTNALLTANQGIGKNLIALTPFMDAPVVFDNITAFATLRYEGTPPYLKIVLTSIPPLNATPPTVALLQAHYYNQEGVYTDDFPANPHVAFNYTGTSNIQTNSGKKVYILRFNPTVQIILQGNAMVAPESHPLHFDPQNDPKSFNLVDPVDRNTVGVANGGWAVSGLYFINCHLEARTTWGLKMAFMLEDGKGPNESLLPPPKDLPKC